MEGFVVFWHVVGVTEPLIPLPALRSPLCTEKAMS
jgi:hypothetical protein